MRNLLPCLALATLALLPLTTPNADACGGYEAARPAPQVTLVSSHNAELSTRGARKFGRRSFAIINNQPTLPEHPSWRRLLSTSYDATQVAPAIAYDVPQTLTLVGSSATRLVKSGRRVALKHAMWQLDSMFEAFELPVQAGDDFVIALRGDHTGAVWHGLDDYRVAGTSLSIKRDRKFGEGPRFTVLDGKRTLGAYNGTVLGALDVDGSRYLVVTAGDGMATTIAVPMS